MKVLFRSLICAAAAIALLAVVSGEADAQKGKGVAGAVVKVDAENLTVKVPEKKKKDQVIAPAREVSYKLNAQTKVEKAGKKDEAAVPAAVADITVGSYVAVVGAEGGAAEKVTIMKKKKE